MEKTKVVNCKLFHGPYDNYVFIGRPSKWGNPFLIGEHGNREEVVKKYEDYILNNTGLLQDLKELKGKILGCFCAPRKCHGDVLARLADQQ